MGLQSSFVIYSFCDCLSQVRRDKQNSALGKYVLHGHSAAVCSCVNTVRGRLYSRRVLTRSPHTHVRAARHVCVRNSGWVHYICPLWPRISLLPAAIGPTSEKPERCNRALSLSPYSQRFARDVDDTNINTDKGSFAVGGLSAVVRWRHLRRSIILTSVISFELFDERGALSIELCRKSERWKILHAIAIGGSDVPMLNVEVARDRRGTYFPALTRGWHFVRWWGK